MYAKQIDYTKYKWIMKHNIELPTDVCINLLNLYDYHTCRNFLRTNKYWYKMGTRYYYYYIKDNTEKESLCLCNLIPSISLIHQHDRNCNYIYTGFFYHRIQYDIKVYGFITNAPLSLLTSNIRAKITDYESCIQIEFERPITCKNLQIHFKNQSININLYAHSEYIKGRYNIYKHHGINVTHTTLNFFSIDDIQYYITCYTSNIKFGKNIL